MLISEAIKTLSEIQEKFGDLKITGGYLSDDTALRDVCVTDESGHEVWPTNPNKISQEVIDKGPLDVFLSA